MFVALSSFFRPGVLARTGSLMILSIVALGAFMSPVTVSVESIGDGVSIVASVSGGEVWANARDTTTGTFVGTTSPAAEGTDPWKIVLSLLNGLTGVFLSILTPFLILCGWLLTPDWVFGEVFGLRPVLHSLWVLVSNIVYIIFAFLLVAMAFMNIFAGEKNTWAIKAKLPKLIIGVISVPFTWFFVSAIISISSILTASAIQLAGDLSPTGPEFTFKVPTKCTIDFTKSPANTLDSSAPSIATKDQNCGDEKDWVPKKLSEMLVSNGSFGILSYYAYSVFQVQSVKDINGAYLKSAKTLLDISTSVLINLIIFIVFALIIIALTISLLMRAIYFWAIAIFSPILSLRYFFDGKLGSIEAKWLTVGNIIGLAMVPVYVALALGFGLIFISAATNLTPTSTNSSYFALTGGDAATGKQSFKILGTEIEVISNPVTTGSLKDVKSLGGGAIGKLIMQIAGLAILWFAVMAALKSNEVTKEASEPIAKFGNDIGGILKKLPQYAPIIPTGHGSASIASIGNISGRIKGDIESAQSNKGQDIGSSLSKAMGIQTVQTVTAIQKIGAQTPTDKMQAGRIFTDMVRAVEADDLRSFSSSSKGRERIAIANAIETKFSGPGLITDKVKLKEITDGLKSNNEETVRSALEKIEHELGAATIGGGNAEFNSIDNASKFIKGLKTGTSSTSSPNSSSGIMFNVNTISTPLNVTLGGNNPAKREVQGTDAQIVANLAPLKLQLVNLSDTARTAARTDLITKLNAASVVMPIEQNKVLSALGLSTINP